MKFYASYVEAILNGGGGELKEMYIEDMLAEFGHNSVGDPGAHTLRVCPACGLLTWMQSESASKPEFLLDYQNKEGYAAVLCDDCQEAYPRNPELLLLVRHMIKHAIYMDKKNQEKTNG